MYNHNTTTQAFGRRFDVHDWLAGQRGGMMLYPLSGILRGLRCTASTNLANNGTTYQIGIEAGAAKIDSVYVELAAAIPAYSMVLPNLPLTGINKYRLFVNPVRQIPAIPVGNPPPASPQVGDRYLQVVNIADWQQLDSIREWNGLSWVAINPVFGPWEQNEFTTYRSTMANEFVSQNNMPLNRVLSVPITAAQLSTRPERPIYHNDALPPTGVAQPRHWLRMSASLLLCEVELLVIVTPAQFDGTSTTGSNVVQGDFGALLLLPLAIRQQLMVTGPGIIGAAFVSNVAPDGSFITLDDTSGPGGNPVNAGTGAGFGVFTLTHPTITHHLVSAQVTAPDRQERVLV